MKFLKAIALGMHALLLAMLVQQVHADWADWWRTPEQQSKAALKSGDIEQLKRVAPDIEWQGVAEHASGDFESAASKFGSAVQQQLADGLTEDANRALYNQGVSEVRAGQYEKAVATFDQVLEQDPQFDDALHNRDIARQLIQQQQEQQQSGDGEGEGESSSQDGEQQPSDESGDPSEDSQNDETGEPGETGEQNDTEQADAGEQSGDEGGDEQPESQAQQEEDEQAAREALEAEARAGEQADDETDAQGERATVEEQPMSESDQATEQWLRRIPDDPAGLLRRKLEQSHRTDYPQVRDSGKPW
ncbi:MAG: tetratricopeptide repeat protein [Granulosicoccus sp.]